MERRRPYSWRTDKQGGWFFADQPNQFIHSICVSEVMMKAVCYVLMVVGLVLAIGGVVAVFNFDQPADMFSWVWWMIVGGWGLALLGMGIDILNLFKVVTREPAYTFQPEVESGRGIEQEITRVS
jgi:hypothetical protein